MRLQPDEKVLTGSWTYENNAMHGDEVCKRIEWLIANELKKITSSPKWGDWETLFYAPLDGRYWERIYPQGHLQGGGPAQLRVITIDEARKKYGA